MPKTRIRITVDPEHDPNCVAELLDALASHLRENGADVEHLLVTGEITGITATADIAWR
jgi:hypothetical protein